MSDIQEIRKGWKTDAFNKLEVKLSRKTNSGRRVQEDECFSIIYGRKDPPEILNLISAEKDKRINETWLQALQKLLLKNQQLNYRQSLHRYPFNHYKFLIWGQSSVKSLITDIHISAYSRIS